MNLQKILDKWIPIGNSLLDEVLKNGIPQGKVNMIIRKSRRIGVSYFNEIHLNWYKIQMGREKRLETIKRIFNI